MVRDSVWVAVDGYSSPTILGIGAQEGLEGIQMQYTWLDAFIGSIPGSIGETSSLFILDFYTSIHESSIVENNSWSFTWNIYNF